MTGPSYHSVGKSIPRFDLTAKLTGASLFAEDLRPQGRLLHGAVLRSPHPHARIIRVDTSKAEALPGVRAVVTSDDLPRIRFGAYIKDEEYLSWDKVRYVGDRIAAVAAETPELAREGAALIDVEYEVLPPVEDAFSALAEGAPQVHPELMEYTVVQAAAPGGGNLASFNELSRGDTDKGFAQSAHIFEEVYTTEMVHQAYLEPHACAAEYDPGGTITVYSATQGIFGLRNMLATVLGVSQNQVRVVATEVGGGFGGKIQMQDEAAAAALARKAGRPVRIVMSREEDFLCGNPRSAFHMTLKTGVSDDGQLVARTMDVVLDSGAHGLGGVLMAWSIPQFAEGPYFIPNLRISVRCAYTTKPPCSSFRAPGGPQTNFAIESEMERIATAMGWDSVAFRRKNLMPQDHTTLAGVVLKSVVAEETLDAILELSAYDPGAVQPAPGRGRGIAMGNWNVGGLPSGAAIKLNDDGSATLLTGVVDLTGVHTALAQIVAEELGLPPRRVTVKALDTESAPHAAPSVGSQALKSMGTAAIEAAKQVRRQLFELAVEDLDVTPDHMTLEEGEVRVTTEPGRGVAVTVLLARSMAQRGPVVGLGGTGAFSRLPSFAANVADVEVDTETGQVRLLRFCAAQDTGLAINPAAVDGQVQGGVAQGIGMALCEEMIYRDGKLANAGFLDYKIPSALDLPAIETVFVEKPATEGPFGAKGIGEPPVVPPPAAIANAIFHAVGVRITSLPITPEKLLRALREREG